MNDVQKPHPESSWRDRSAQWLSSLVASAPKAEQWSRIQWPRSLDSRTVATFLEQLAAQERPRVVGIELRAHKGALDYFIGVHHMDATELERGMAAFLRDVTCTPHQREAIAPTVVAELRLASHRYALRETEPDVIARTIVAAAHASGSTKLAIRLILGRRVHPHVAHIPPVSGGSSAEPRSVGRLFLDHVIGAPPVSVPDHGELRRKSERSGFVVAVLIAAEGERPAAGSALRRVTQGFAICTAPHNRWRTRRARRWLLNELPSYAEHGSVLTCKELLGMLAWPIGDESYPGVTRLRSRHVPVPPGVPRRGLGIGDGTHPSSLRPVAIAHSDALMHTHVVGVTGTGKSTLCTRLALDAINANSSLMVVDLKGDLISSILERVPRSVSEKRRIVVIDPSDPAPIGLNPLAGTNANTAADHVMAVFRGLYGDALGPRTGDVLHAALLTLAKRRLPLAALPYLLSDAAVRRALTGNISEAVLADFWRWFDALSAAHRVEVVSPVMNKVRPLLIHPAVNAMLSQSTPQFNLAELFTQPTVVLVSLQSGVIGSEAAGLIGSLLISELWQATRAQAGVPATRRRRVGVIIDEFQHVVHIPTDLGDALAEARGLGVGFTLAHQHLGQLPPAMRAAVMANARNKLCFQLSHEDAKVFAGLSGTLDAADFTGLGRYELFASVVADNEVNPFASVRTRALPPRVGDEARWRQRSRAQFGRTHSEIESEFDQLVASLREPSQASPIGKRPRTAEQTQQRSES